MKQQSVKARITKDHLQARPRRRVTGQEGVDILLKPLEKHRFYYILGVPIRVPKGRVHVLRCAGVRVSLVTSLVYTMADHWYQEYPASAATLGGKYPSAFVRNSP